MAQEKKRETFDRREMWEFDPAILQEAAPLPRRVDGTAYTDDGPGKK